MGGPSKLGRARAWSPVAGGLLAPSSASFFRRFRLQAQVASSFHGFEDAHSWTCLFEGHFVQVHQRRELLRLLLGVLAVCDAQLAAAKKV